MTFDPSQYRDGPKNTVSKEGALEKSLPAADHSSSYYVQYGSSRWDIAISYDTIRYDTIAYESLTWTEKLSVVSLIYLAHEDKKNKKDMYMVKMNLNKLQCTTGTGSGTRKTMAESERDEF